MHQKVIAFFCIYIIGINLFILGCRKDTEPEIIKPIVELGEQNPAFSPDGKFVAYVDSNGISLLDLSTKNSAHLTDGWSPDWSPDSKWIVYVRASDIYKININTNEIKQLTTFVNCYFPDWSANGTRIAFDISGGDSGGIWLMDTNGTNYKRIKQYVRMPDWSPMGDRLVHIGWVGNMAPSEIFIIDSTGNNNIRLTDNQTDDNQPTWSPNSSQIAYVSATNGGYPRDIFLINTDGTNKVQLTYEPESENGVVSCEPAWSPDGNNIVYVRIEEFENDQTIELVSHLWIMDADGENKRQLTGR